MALGRPLSLLLALPIVFAAAARSEAQVALAVRAGSTGIGVDASFAVNENVGLRAAGSMFALSADWDDNDARFAADLDLKLLGGYVDLHPGGGAFRFTAGLVRDKNKVEAIATPLAGSFELNGVDWPAASVGELRLVGEASRTWAPYLGLGFGSATGEDRLFFVLDAGVMFHGQPGVRLSASGPLATNADFLRDLRAEQEKMNRDDLGSSWYQYYPVVSLGLGFRF